MCPSANKSGYEGVNEVHAQRRGEIRLSVLFVLLKDSIHPLESKCLPLSSNSSLRDHHGRRLAAIATSASYLFVGREDDSGFAGSPRIVRTLCHSGNAAAPAAPAESLPPPMSLPSLQKLYLEFHAPKQLLENLAVEMIAEMEKGRAKDNCDIKMLPSFVCDLPTGKENGKYLALDLGGSNFRVLRFKVENGDVTLEASKKAKIPKELMSKSSTGVDMFQFIADTVAQLPKTGPRCQRSASARLYFFISCKHYRLNAGTLLHWTKGSKPPAL